MYLAGIDHDGKELGNCRPCYMCAKLLLNAGIVNVVTRDDSLLTGGTLRILHGRPEVINSTDPLIYVGQWETEIFGGKEC
jgi:tRNA(Arg) A34 adenosine deaminase TadA